MDNELREHRAKDLLDNPLFQEAFDVLKEDLMGRWSQAVQQIWKLENQSGLQCDCLIKFMLI